MRQDTGPSAGAAMVLFDQPGLILFLMSPPGLGDWVNAVVSDFRLIQWFLFNEEARVGRT